MKLHKEVWKIQDIYVIAIFKGSKHETSGIDRYNVSFLSAYKSAKYASITRQMHC